MATIIQNGRRFLVSIFDRVSAVSASMIRSAAQCTGMPWRIEVIEGDSAPTLVGQGYHWTTKAGTPVRYPNAYRRIAKSATLVYHPSTRRIVVGREWMLAQVWSAN